MKKTDLNEQELKILSEINSNLLEKEKYNLYNCNPIYVLFMRGENIKIDEEKQADGISFLIENNYFETLDDLILNLKFATFEAIFKMRKFLYEKSKFSIDKNGKIFTFTDSKTKEFLEAKEKILKCFEYLESFKNIHEVVGFIRIFEEQNNVKIKEFSSNLDDYQIEFYKKKFIPIVVSSNLKLINKCKSALESQNEEVILKKYSKDDKENKINIFRKALTKIIENLNN